ncbi:MAG: hypothetical protein HYV59_02955 [Planctomycetes bacterium]|nr:hypothetical protein [Planctomycetota bacterium]
MEMLEKSYKFIALILYRCGANSICMEIIPYYGGVATKARKGDVWQVAGDVFSRHTAPDTRHLKNLTKKAEVPG